MPTERLAHRACNTNRGATTPVVAWPDHLFVVDPAPIITGRAVMACCPTHDDAASAAACC